MPGVGSRVALTTVGREFERRVRFLLDELDTTLLSVRGVPAGNARYFDASGAEISGDAFFAQAAGRRVRVTGAVSGADVAGQRFEIHP